ncbi:hypothetical protein BKH46_09000 [Helicobacter sp. 12S02634-8]|nr:hypothetical protein BKH46_09000 [Helicobacter sp. 12S02634-8]
MRIRVYYEDTDCGGIIYHTNYIKYCERDRSERFFNAKITPHQSTSGFVVRTLQADFIGSAALGDMLEVHSQVTKLKNVSVFLHQEIYKTLDHASQQPCRLKIFQMEVKLGHINFTTQSPCPIPMQFLEILRKS